MRILHVLYMDRFSGAENVACRIIDLFRQEPGVEMAYCSRDGQIRQVLEERRIDFYPIADLTHNELERVIAQFHPDLLHAHDFRASIACSAFARRIPVISHLHNNPPWLKKPGPRSIAYAWSCRKYSRILTVSDSVLDEFIFGNRFRSKQFCIGNPIDTAWVRNRAAEFDVPEAYDVCFCGRLSEQKDPLAFLDILSMLPAETTAVMLGDGELRPAVEERLQTLGLTGRVRLAGFVDNPFPTMKQCKVLCMPSRWEGFGLAAVEALALGLPVICSDVGGLPGIVRADCGAICTVPADSARQIAALLTNPDLLAQKRQHALARADELDNCASYQEVLKHVYTAALSHNSDADL